MGAHVILHGFKISLPSINMVGKVCWLAYIINADDINMHLVFVRFGSDVAQLDDSSYDRCLLMEPCFIHFHISTYNSTPQNHQFVVIVFAYNFPMLK